MKKLLTICLLLVATFTVNAQEKPTKEATIAYLNKTLQMSVGYKAYGTNGGNRVSSRLIKQYSFLPSEVKLSWETFDFRSNDKRIEYEQFSNINWEYLTTIIIDSEDNENHDDELAQIVLYFSDKIRYDKTIPGVNVIMDDDMHYPKYLYIYVLKTKADNFKRALERLVEIAKEENKDPFDK